MNRRNPAHGLAVMATAGARGLHPGRSHRRASASPAGVDTQASRRTAVPPPLLRREGSPAPRRPRRPPRATTTPSPNHPAPRRRPRRTTPRHDDALAEPPRATTTPSPNHPAPRRRPRRATPRHDDARSGPTSWEARPPRSDGPSPRIGNAAGRRRHRRGRGSPSRRRAATRGPSPARDRRSEGYLDAEEGRHQAGQRVTREDREQCPDREVGTEGDPRGELRAAGQHQPERDDHGADHGAVGEHD
jgi:hypothetical protein